MSPFMVIPYDEMLRVITHKKSPHQDNPLPMRALGEKFRANCYTASFKPFPGTSLGTFFVLIMTRSKSPTVFLKVSGRAERSHARNFFMASISLFIASRDCIRSPSISKLWSAPSMTSDSPLAATSVRKTGS